MTQARKIASSLGALLSLLLCGQAGAVDTTWIFDGDGNWTDSASWSNGEPVDSTYNVFIDDGDVPVTVTLGASRTIAGLGLGTDDTLRIQAPTTGNIALTSANGFTNTGRIIVANSTGGQTASLVIQSGTLTNGAAGTLQFSDGSGASQFMSGDLINNGAILIQRSTSFNKSNGAYRNNGTFDISSGQNLTLLNAGTFEEAAGTLTIHGQFQVTGNSALNVTGGTVDVVPGASFFVEAGSSLNLSGTGVINMNSSTTGSGGGGAFNQTGGTLNITSGTIGSSTFNFQGGTVNGELILGNSTLQIGAPSTGPATFVLRDNNTFTGNVFSGQVLDIRHFISGSVTSVNGFTNEGTIKFSNQSQTTDGRTLTLTNGTLLNSATGLVNFSDGTNTFSGNLTNDGTVAIEGNTTFGKTAGAYRNNNAFSISAGRTLTVSGGGAIEQAAGNMTVNGSLTAADTSVFNLTGGVLNVNGMIGGGMLTQTGGTLNFQSGQINQFRYLGGSLVGVPIVGAGALVIGTGITTPYEFDMRGGALTLTDHAVLGNQILHLSGGVVSADGFTNSGTLIGSLTVTNGTLTNASTGLMRVEPGKTSAVTFAANITNSGTVDIGGPVNFNKSGGTFVNQNQVTISSPQVTTVTGGTFDQVSGTLDITGLMSVSSGTFWYEGGRINGTPFLSGSTLRIEDSVSPASFILEGNSTLSLPDGVLPAGQSLTVRNTATTTQGLTSATGFTNSGSTALTATSSGTTSLSITSGALINGATGVLEFQQGGTGSRSLSADFTNNGTVEVNQSTSFGKASAAYVNNGQFTVASTKTLTVSNSGTFKQAGGTLDVLGTFTLTSGTFEQAGGTLNVVGALTVNSGTTFKYTGGTIIGTPLITAPQFSSNASLSVSASAINSASFILEGNTTLTLPDAILPAGTVLTTRNNAAAAQGLTTASGFTNNGSIGIAATNSRGMTFTVTSGTLVNGASGTLQFKPSDSAPLNFVGDLTNNGTVEINSSTTFSKTNGVFTNNGQFTIAASQSLTVPGFFSNASFEQAGGTMDVLGAYVQTAGTFKFSGGVIHGTPQINSGTFVIGPGASGPFNMRLSFSTLSAADKKLYSGQSIDASDSGLTLPNAFTNNGSIKTGNISASNAAISNGATGVIDFQSTSSTAPTFNGSLANDGTVLITESTAFGGSFSASHINRGHVTVASGQALSFTNTSTFEHASGVLDILGAWTQSAGTFKFSGGTINGTVGLIGGTLVVGPGATGAASFLMDNNSTLSVASNVLSAGQTITMRSNASPSTFTSANGFTNNGSILVTGTQSQATTFSITNGTLINGTTGLLDIQPNASGARTFTGNLTNNGTVLVERSTTFNRTNGTYENYGQFTIASSQTLDLSSGSYSQFGGTTTVNGTLLASTNLIFTGGRLMGNGSILAPISVIGGTLEPGQSVGALGVTNYNQALAGSLIIELGGAGTGQFDKLNVTGNAILGGTLDVRLVDLVGNGTFSPVVGQSFQFLTATGGVINKFQNLLLPDIGPDLRWNILYGTTSVTLAVVPEPGAIVLVLFGVASMAPLKRRTRRVQQAVVPL